MSDRFYVVVVPAQQGIAQPKCYGPFVHEEVAQAISYGYQVRASGQTAGYPMVYEVEKP